MFDIHQTLTKVFKHNRIEDDIILVKNPRIDPGSIATQIRKRLQCLRMNKMLRQNSIEKVSIQILIFENEKRRKFDWFIDWWTKKSTFSIFLPGKCIEALSLLTFYFSNDHLLYVKKKIGEFHLIFVTSINLFVK